jgi:transcriptional regulator with XRE-family HTH domain
MVSKRPSEFVGPQVRSFRRRREWLQADLVARLEELGFRGWRQSKIAKIENGEAKRLPLDEVFELAAALDVSPLYLFTPGDKETPLPEVQLGPKISRPAAFVREWVQGGLPLFDPEEDPAGARFYLVESIPADLWDHEEWVRAHWSLIDERTRLARSAGVPLGEWEAVKDRSFELRPIADEPGSYLILPMPDEREEEKR